MPVASLAREEMGFSGEEVAERVVRASVFAEVDPYRAATHNKGIMNGVDAFLLATGQDWRAVEAGAHAYASRDGSYTAFATWRLEGDELVGRITLPMQVGTVGGVTRVHPVVKVLLKVLGVSGASAVGRVAAAVGLAQNLAAILALATEGIQRGHMSLHARNIAAAAGARESQVEDIVAEMIRRKTISHDAAREILDGTQGGDQPSPEGGLDFAVVQQLVQKHWPQMEELMAELMPRGSEGGALGEMIWYQADSGGKRLRAILPLLVFRALGADPARAVPFGAALELVHNATLIHNDAEGRVRTRRGAEALWVKYGIDQAINVGDAMMCLALHCLGRLQEDPGVVRQLETRLTTRMLQVIQAQVETRQNTRSLEAWEALTRERTGGLLGTAIAGSALLVGATDATVATLERLGGHLGLIFQVQDELMDLTGGKRGLARARSIVEGRMGLLLAHGVSVAPEPEARRLEQILATPARDTKQEEIDEALAAVAEAVAAVAQAEKEKKARSTPRT